MKVSPQTLREQAEHLVQAYTKAGLTIATAESCTGGLVAAFLTDVPGSSAVLERGFVTYSNAAKTEMLGVDAALVEREGAVSAPVATAMAEGALARSKADVCVSITGIAGPGGGSSKKPVGLVHFACATRRGTAHREGRFGEIGRDGVRLASVAAAFDLLEERLAEHRIP